MLFRLQIAFIQVQGFFLQEFSLLCFIYQHILNLTNLIMNDFYKLHLFSELNFDLINDHSNDYNKIRLFKVMELN